MARDGIIQVRVNTKLKQQAEALFEDLGLDMASAIRMFLKQSVMYQGIPFQVVRQPSYISQAEMHYRETAEIEHAQKVQDEPVYPEAQSSALINDMDIDL